MRNEQGAPFRIILSGGHKKKNPSVQFTAEELLDNKMMDSIAGYMEKLSGTITNGGSVFDQYLQNFTAITVNNTALLSKVGKQQG